MRAAPGFQGCREWRYLGGPYPWYGGRDQTRLLITIGANKINSMG